MKKVKLSKFILLSTLALVFNCLSIINAHASVVSTVPDTPTLGDQVYRNWTFSRGYNLRIGFNPVDTNGPDPQQMINSIDQIELTVIPSVGSSETFTNSLHIVFQDGFTPGFNPNNILEDPDTHVPCNQVGEPVACWQIPTNAVSYTHLTLPTKA